MAVPNLQKLGVDMAVSRQDKAYKHYTSNPISIIILHAQHCFPVISNRGGS